MKTSSGKISQERMDVANKMLTIIGSHGRKFFEHHGAIGYFKAKNGHLYFVDSYSKKEIYLSYKYWNRGFSQGGTMRQLVIELRLFIKGERDLPLGFLGPWPQSFCNGDLWGYGQEMEIVRVECKKLVELCAQ